MAKAKTKAAQAAELRAFRTKVAKLKAAGLTKVDARSQKMTRHMKAQIAKYSDVIAGSSVTVKIPKKAAPGLKDNFRVKNGRAVVAKPQLGGKARYSKKYGEIVTTATVGGRKFYSVSRRFSYEEMQALAKKPGVSFAIPIRQGSAVRWKRGTLQDVEDAVGDKSSFRNFADWFQFVNVEFYEGKGRKNPLFEFDDGEGEDGEE